MQIIGIRRIDRRQISSSLKEMEYRSILGREEVDDARGAARCTVGNSRPFSRSARKLETIGTWAQHREP